ncbi:PilN domain-containing protein [Desulfotalea psychrophila]|uniref:Related to fimbrial assembly protein PilN n=1 Tax=Desulfotalea psychrophila (strain LSv54 / DSM 12343) TaxID=177439 RepID=Q6AS37_DESPS|nr:PilN domain-containing protein [Desulfotalea psychrophila]CAG34838.1 related to fimbrial assembly protein PilN [Desulfotalea psychrophila LSv54]
MLKINLLPIRQLKKRAEAKKQLLMIFISLCFIIFACTLVGIHQSGTIVDLEDSISRLHKEKNSYNPILKKIENLKKHKAELERKTAVIKTLQLDSSLSMHVLDEVSNSVDNKRMWINSLDQNGGSLRISGIALDNRTISDFMNTLKSSPFIREVNLTGTSMQQVSGRNLKKFSLTCAVSVPQQKVAQVKKS